MVDISNREYVGGALGPLAVGVESHIWPVLESAAPGIPWPAQVFKGTTEEVLRL